MTEETLAPQEPGQPAATALPADARQEDLPFLTIPAPPVIGKIAWSLSPWLPE